MFFVAEDHKKGLATTPIIWVKSTATETGYYWPLRGLHFKLKNYSPLPVDPDELKNEWRYVPCKILLNGERFRTLLLAEKALSEILKSSNEVEAEVIAGQLVVGEVVADKVVVEQQKVDETETVEDAVGVAHQVGVGETAAAYAEEEEDAVSVRKLQTDSDSEDESFRYFQINDGKTFKLNEGFIKKKTGFSELEEFYLEINLNSERKFFDKCVKKSFTDSFFLSDISFKKDSKRQEETDWIGVFDETRLYTCMKSAVVKKLKMKDLDDTELKKMFVRNFERYKRAIKARL